MMQIMKHTLQFLMGFLLLSSGILEINLYAEKPSNDEPAASFDLTDEEISSMTADLSEAEAKEFKQIIEGMKSLTPAQLQELEEIGRQTEKKMRAQGLDPANQKDMRKFLESEGLVQQPPQKAQPGMPVQPKAPIATSPEPKIPTKQFEPIAPLTSRIETSEMINQLVDRLAALRQKVITRPSLLSKFTPLQNEVIELIVYLNKLRAPDLIKLLKEKEFARLTNSLETLHAVFIRYEPSISARKRSTIINEDDPYEVLDLPYNATAADIEDQFKQFTAIMGPKAVEKQIKKQGLDKSKTKKVRKSAARTFSVIESSYKSLKDEESRTKIDNELRIVIDAESLKERQSVQAFDKLFSALTSAIMTEKIIQQMNQLLEKYKPEEAKQLKQQIEREKQAFERSKKRIEVPQISAAAYQMREMNDSFYRKPSRPERKFPRYPGNGVPDRRGRPETGARPGQAGAGAADKSKKPDKAGDKGKAKENEKDTKGAKKDPKATPAPISELSDKDIELLTSIKQVEKIATKAEEKEGKIKVKRPTRAGAIEEVEIGLPVILKNLDSYLLKNEEPEAPAELKKFFDEHGFTELEKNLKSLAESKKKLPEGPVAKSWKAKVAPKIAPFAQANKEIIKYLDLKDTKERHSVPGQLLPGKAREHGLDLKDTDPWKKAKKGEPEEPKPDLGEKVNLGALRSTAKNINTYLGIIQGT